MVAYTANQLENIAAGMLDFYLRNPSKDSATYMKPTADKMIAKRKSFGATKGEISLPVRLTHGNAGVNDGLVGIGPRDKLLFGDHSNDRRATFTRRKHHKGIEIAEDELEDAGIQIVDEMGATSGGGTGQHAQLKSYLKSKMDDFNEDWNEKFSRLLWGDGAADALAMAGIRAIILDDPTSGTVGGLSMAANSLWRNRAYTAAHAASGGTGAITSSVSNGGELCQILHKDNRQLQRYGSKVDLRPCGSDFIDALEREMRANGNYSETGFSMGGDVQVGGIKLNGVGFYYEPELDLIGREKYSYAISSKDVCLYVREGQWKQMRNPARPYDQLVIHKSVLTTMQLCADKLNGSAVYQIN